MQKILELYKKEGETPLEAIEEFRKKNLEYSDVKMTYAGRLDPMAEGVLLVLVGDECKNKENYLGLDKEYEFEILHGIQTDTYDILGLPAKSGTSDVPQIEIETSNTSIDAIEKSKGKFTQKYPPYSSMTVQGKQLFQWAREGRLDEIEKECLDSPSGRIISAFVGALVIIQEEGPYQAEVGFIDLGQAPGHKIGKVGLF